MLILILILILFRYVLIHIHSRGTPMFVTYPFGENTVTINIAHVSHVVWSKPVAGATVVTSVFMVGGGRSVDLHLTPVQIKQLEGNLADYNRKH